MDRNFHLQSHEIVQRYCSFVDANVVVAKINKDANEAPRYRCLSAHLCDGECKRYKEQSSLT